MASYTDTKQYLLDAFPSLFVEEADVLFHLFFCTGSYEWVEGQLVDVCSPEAEVLNAAAYQESSRKWLEGRLQNASEDGSESSVQFYQDALALLEKSPKEQREIERQKRIRRYTDSSCRPSAGSGVRDCFRVTAEGTFQHYFGGFNQFISLLKMPIDVQPDWLAAAQAALALVGTVFISHPEDAAYNAEWLRQAEVHVKEIADACATRFNKGVGE